MREKEVIQEIMIQEVHLSLSDELGRERDEEEGAGEATKSKFACLSMAPRAIHRYPKFSNQFHLSFLPFGTNSWRRLLDEL